MATPRLLSLSRHLISRSTTATTVVSRNSLLRALSAFHLPRATVSPIPSRSFSSRQSQHSMNDNNPNFSNRPPNETILLDGCDFEHWLVVTDPPPEDWTRDQIIDYYIKTLATVVGSEDEARMKLYSVSTKHYFAFGALISEELSNKLKEMEKVRWVLPDSYLDVRNKNYGGEPVIDGQAVPYDPKYHEEWVRNNQKSRERNNRNDRPRNADRSRNFDRRQRTQSSPNPPGGNMGGVPNQPSGPPNNLGYGPNTPPANSGFQQNMAQRNPGYQPNMPPNNTGYQQTSPPNNAGYQPMPPNNVGYPPNMPSRNAGYQQNIPPNNAGYQQNMPPQNNQGFAQNMPPPNNVGGNFGGQVNPGYVNNTVPNNQAGGGMPYQNNSQTGGQQNYQPNGGYQGQNVPGREMP